MFHSEHPLTRRSIGGTIGTALYVQIGRGLLNGGPGSLFIAFTMWCSVILAVTLCMAEMVTYLPISSPFIRFAGRYADEAFGFAVRPYTQNRATVIGKSTNTHL